MSDNEKVLVITDTRGVIIHVGDPKSFSAKQINQYVQEGCKTETMTIKKYKSLKKGLYEERAKPRK